MPELVPVVLAAVVGASAYGLGNWTTLPQLALLKLVLAVPAILVAPGYVVVKLFFGELGSDVEKYVLSVGLSVSIIGLWAVLLDALGLPVTGKIVGLPTLMCTLLFASIIVFRSKRHVNAARNG